MYIHEFEEALEHTVDNTTLDQTKIRDDFSAEELAILNQYN